MSLFELKFESAPFSGDSVVDLGIEHINYSSDNSCEDGGDLSSAHDINAFEFGLFCRHELFVLLEYLSTIFKV